MSGMNNQVLKAALHLGTVTHGSLARRFVVTADHAEKICLGMVEDGLLARAGKDRYEITMKGRIALDPWRYQGGIGRVPVSNFP